MKQLIHTILKASSLFLAMTFVILLGCQQQPDYSKELKPLVDKYNEVWQTGNVSDLDAIMDPNFVRHSEPGTSAEGMINLKKVINEFKTAYPDVKLVSEEEIYSENTFAGRWTITATNTGPGTMPPTGKSVKFWGINIIHFQNGKIVEEWDAADTQPLLEQLGFMMMPASETKK